MLPTSGEEPRTIFGLLRTQTGRLALLDGFVVSLTRLLLLHDLSGDASAVSSEHLECADGRPRRYREHVLGFDGLTLRIGETLFDEDASVHVDNIDLRRDRFEVGVLERGVLCPVAPDLVGRKDEATRRGVAIEERHDADRREDDGSLGVSIRTVAESFV